MVDKKEVTGKYGALIQKAREPENQITNQPETQVPDKTDNHQEVLIQELANQETSQPESQISGKPENHQEGKNIKPDDQITGKPEQAKDREVNLCVKVPESLRRHWAAEAKREGITMTEVMVEALIKRFGKP